MLLDFTAQYFTHGLFIGLSFHSSTFSLPFFFFLSETSFLTSERRRWHHRVWKPERTHGDSTALLRGNVLVSCDIFSVCLLGLYFLLCPAASARGLDTLRCHELIGLSSEDSTPCSFELTGTFYHDLEHLQEIS